MDKSDFYPCNAMYIDIGGLNFTANISHSYGSGANIFPYKCVLYDNVNCYCSE